MKKRLWLLDGFKSPDHCMIAREAKTVTVSHKFKALRDESLANITTDLGKRLRMNRSIQTMV